MIRLSDGGGSSAEGLLLLYVPNIIEMIFVRSQYCSIDSLYLVTGVIIGHEKKIIDLHSLVLVAHSRSIVLRVRCAYAELLKRGFPAKGMRCTPCAAVSARLSASPFREIRRYHPYARKLTSQAVLGKMDA